MTANNVKIKSLLSNIVTDAALTGCKLAIEELRDASYKNADIHQTKEYEKIDNMLGRKLSVYLKESGDASIMSFINDFEDYVKHVEVVEITLCFDPMMLFLSQIHTWLANQFPFPFVLKIKKDPTIAGGIVIEYQGKYLDLSLKKKISDYLSNNQAYVLSKL